MKANLTTALAEVVDRVLWEHWDPIHLNDNPNARNEYSSYVPSVVRLLQDGSDAFKIAQHLHSLERVSMGIETYQDHRSRTAQLLIDEYRKIA